MKTSFFLLIAALGVCPTLPGVAGEPVTRPAASGESQHTDLWIDVHSPDEYAAGHLEGGLNIPHDQIGERIGALVPDQHTAIRLYCCSGRRSGLAQETLRSLGYTQVSNAGAYEKLHEGR